MSLLAATLMTTAGASLDLMREVYRDRAHAWAATCADPKLKTRYEMLEPRFYSAWAPLRNAVPPRELQTIYLTGDITSAPAPHCVADDVAHSWFKRYELSLARLEGAAR